MLVSGPARFEMTERQIQRCASKQGLGVVEAQPQRGLVLGSRSGKVARAFQQRAQVQVHLRQVGRQRQGVSQAALCFRQTAKLLQHHAAIAQRGHVIGSQSQGTVEPR